tara:strand:+ start:747 stop:2225 length:1479 start_codon:yes stop_codon:yes gene_type:complete
MIQSFLNKKSEFTKNIGKLFLSNIVYQILLYVAHFFIIKNYLPQDYGVFTSIMSLSSIVSVLFTLRLDLAYVSKKSNKMAQILITGLVLQVVLLCFLSSILIAFYSFLFKGKIVYMLLPPAGLIIALSHILTAYLVRRKRFFCSGILLILQSVFFLTGVIMLSNLTKNPSSLYFSRIFSYFAAVFIIFLIQKKWKLSIKFLYNTTLFFRHLNLFKVLLKKNWRYIFFNTPYSLIGLVSRDSSILLFAYFGDLQTSGYLALIKTVFNAPIYFISSSLSSVIHKEAAEHLGKPCFSEKIINTSLFIFKLSWLPIIFLFLEGEELFRFFLGDRWSKSGYYASILAPSLFLSLFCVCNMRIFDVAKKQKDSFIIQIFFDVLTVLVIFFLIKFNFAINKIIYTLTILNSIYYLLLIHFVFKISNIPLKNIMKKAINDCFIIYPILFSALIHFTMNNIILKMILFFIVYVYFLYKTLKIASCDSYNRLREGKPRFCKK